MGDFPCVSHNQMVISNSNGLFRSAQNSIQVSAQHRGQHPTGGALLGRHLARGLDLALPQEQGEARDGSQHGYSQAWLGMNGYEWHIPPIITYQVMTDGTK